MTINNSTDINKTNPSPYLNSLNTKRITKHTDGNQVHGLRQGTKYGEVKLRSQQPYCYSGCQTKNKCNLNSNQPALKCEKNIQNNIIQPLFVMKSSRCCFVWSDQYTFGLYSYQYFRLTILRTTESSKYRAVTVKANITGSLNAHS